MNLISKIIRTIERHPESIALKMGEEEWTFGRLWMEGLQVYAQLKHLGVKEEFVGIDGEHGLKSYAYILGIWLYGAAYVPLMPSFPREKTRRIIEESGIKYVFSTWKNWDIPVISGKKNFEFKYEGKGLKSEYAYVLFTSGSTGVPKGVPITFENLNAFSTHYLQGNAYNFSQTDIFLQSYELNFDVSVFCYLIPFILGAKLVLIPSKSIKFLSILATLQKEKITVTSNVPSLLKCSLARLAEINLPNLKYSFFSGESLPGIWAKQWMQCVPNAKVYNCYGPTETSIVCTTECLNLLPEKYFNNIQPLPLGKPFEKTQMALYKDEICFQGGQVFKGYLNQKTPSVLIDGKKYYPTGDLGAMNEDGKLIFKGRKDRQIQLNGYRIELDEIDVILQSFLKYSTKTFFKSNTNGEGYIVSVLETQAFDELNIKTFLSSKLPAYSLPKQFFAVESFPCNSNQKLDIQKLALMIQAF